MRTLWMILFLISILVSDPAMAMVYRKGCEEPQFEVTVCWEVTAPEEGSYAPLMKDIHILPVVQEVAGEKNILGDYTRTIYRQLMTSDLTQADWVQEWQPVTHLNEALVTTRAHRWPMALWISPRVMRESGPATAGLVDWNLYLIAGEQGKLLRTLRIKVESPPRIRNEGRDPAMAVAGLSYLTGVFGLSPLTAVGSVIATDRMAPPGPPEAGYALELMTELAVREFLTLMRFPAEELVSTLQH